MDLHDLITCLRQASELDLLRLRTAIDHLLQQLTRIVAIRQRLHIGQQVDYLNLREIQMRRGRIIEFKPDQVLIHAEDLSKYWRVPYASIQTDSAPMPTGTFHCSDPP